MSSGPGPRPVQAAQDAADRGDRSDQEKILWIEYSNHPATVSKFTCAASSSCAQKQLVGSRSPSQFRCNGKAKDSQEQATVLDSRCVTQPSSTGFRNRKVDQLFSSPSTTPIQPDLRLPAPPSPPLCSCLDTPVTPCCTEDPCRGCSSAAPEAEDQESPGPGGSSASWLEAPARLCRGQVMK